jgi:cell division protein FtsL
MRQKTEQDQEEEMMRQVMEQSAQEEEARVKRIAAEKYVLLKDKHETT